MSTNGNEKADSKLLDIEAIESGLRERLKDGVTRAPSRIPGTSDCVVWQPWDGSRYEIVICEADCEVLIDTQEGTVPLGRSGIYIARTPDFAGGRIGYVVHRATTLDQLEHFLTLALTIVDFAPWMVNDLRVC
jgi:hypothetical protein